MCSEWDGWLLSFSRKPVPCEPLTTSKEKVICELVTGRQSSAGQRRAAQVFSVSLRRCQMRFCQDEEKHCSFSLSPPLSLALSEPTTESSRTTCEIVSSSEIFTWIISSWWDGTVAFRSFENEFKSFVVVYGVHRWVISWGCDNEQRSTNMDQG